MSQILTFKSSEFITQTKITMESSPLDNLLGQNLDKRDLVRTMDKLRTAEFGLTNDDNFLFLVALSRTSFSTTTSC